MVHVGIHVMPSGRCRLDLMALFWTWNMRVHATLAAENARTILAKGNEPGQER